MKKLSFAIAISLFVSLACQCSNLTDCFNCSASSNPQCAWIEGRCDDRASSLNPSYFYLLYENCTDKASVELQERYCGSGYLVPDLDQIEASLPYVDSSYGTPNLLCKYVYTNDDANNVVYVSIKIKRGILGTLSLLLKAKFLDDTIKYREVDKVDFSVRVEKSREVTIYKLSKESFSSKPFVINITSKLPGISVTLILTICLVIAACIICSSSIFFFSRKIARRNALVAAQRNIFSNRESRHPRPGLPMAIFRERAEDLKKKKKLQLENLLKDAMKPQKYKPELGKFNLNCSICLEEYDKSSKVTLTKCSHLFHYDCLKGWLMQNLLNSKCPNCNCHLLPDLGDMSPSTNNNLVVQHIDVGSIHIQNSLPSENQGGYNSINVNSIPNH